MVSKHFNGYDFHRYVVVVDVAFFRFTVEYNNTTIVKGWQGILIVITGHLSFLQGFSSRHKSSQPSSACTLRTIFRVSMRSAKCSQGSAIRVLSLGGWGKPNLHDVVSLAVGEVLAVLQLQNKVFQFTLYFWYWTGNVLINECAHILAQGHLWSTRHNGNPRPETQFWYHNLPKGLAGNLRTHWKMCLGGIEST